jgi:hypothetical protein
VDPITVLTGLGVLGTGFTLLGAGVKALWKIAGGLGKFEAKTTTILGAMQVMLQDHEERLRTIERRR